MSEYTQGQKITVRTDFDKCKYITAHKDYDAEVYDAFGDLGFSLFDDQGDHLFCRLNKCGHLGFSGSWEVVQ